MTEYSVVPATEELYEDLAPRLSQEDRDEIWAALHEVPERALKVGLLASRQPICGLIDGVPHMAAGIAYPSFLGDIYKGIPWMMGSEELRNRKHMLALLRPSKVYIQEQKRDYAYLENYVDARHVLAVKWLEWLGFNMEEPEPFGIDRLPFHRFWMRGHHHVMEKE